jgi:poly(A) polymerase
MTGLKDEAIKIIRCLRQHQFKAYFAGGSVRDMLMGIEPQDYDIATSASINQIRKLFPKTIILGAQFPIVMVISNHYQYQLTPFRGPEPWSEEDDARLRDFTINGLFYDPLQDKILDYVEGQKDIQAKLIRAIGDPRKCFREDPLRLMRAIRLANCYQFQIEENTLNTLKELSAEIVKVSPERIRDELIKILTHKHAYAGTTRLIETGLMQHILPEVTAMYGVEQPPQYHPEGDVLTHTLLMLKYMEAPSIELAVAVLLHDIGKPLTYQREERITFKNHAKIGASLAEKICQRLRFSRRETEKIVSLIKNHLKFIQVQEMRLNKLKRFLQMEDIAEHLELHRLDCLASHGNLSNWEFCQQKLRELKAQALRPPRLITGHDLIALGYKPSPLFAKALSLVEDAQLEEKISTREEALKLVTDYFSQHQQMSL